MKKLAVFDGTNMVFRSYFAVPTLNTSDGQPTNAVFGFLNLFRSVINDLKPDYVIVGFDSGKPTFRHLLDPTYKAHRPPAHEDLKSQFSIIRDALHHLQIPLMIAPDGMENDDLLGTLAKKASESGYEAFIVSSDKDFYQLCSDTLKVYSFTVKKKDGKGIVDAHYVRREYGCEPMQLVHMKALTGEACDNIRGVSGIGPKTALNLIVNHGTVQNVVDYMGKNPDAKLANKINASVPIIENAFQLALINIDADLPVNVPVKPVSKIMVDEKHLWDFFKHYELESLSQNFHAWTNMFKYAHGVSA